MWHDNPVLFLVAILAGQSVWYENTALIAAISSVVTLLLPKLFGFLTRHHAEVRAATLREITDRTNILVKQSQRLDDEIEAVRERNMDLEAYICELEALLRGNNIPIPTPPWAVRRSEQRRRFRSEEDK